MKNFLYTNVYDGNISAIFTKYKFLSKNKSEYDLVIDSQFEDYDFLHNNVNFTDLLNNNSKKPKVILSHQISLTQKQNIDLIYFPESFLKFGYQHIFIPDYNQIVYQNSYQNNHLIQTISRPWYERDKKIINNLNDLNYKYHFINLNFKNHYHRKVLIDNLAKNKLISKNAVTWHNISSPKIEPTYFFEHFNIDTLKLSGHYSNFIDTGIKPEEYYNSFCELVSESSCDKIWLTEKTASPLIIGKPFLVAGAVNFHSFLKSMGFELFEEIFDYAFDNETYLKNRIIKLVENLVRLQDISLNDLKSLNVLIKDKILHNQNLAKKIAFDDTLYPDILKYVIENFTTKNQHLNSVFINSYKNLQVLRHTHAK